VIGRSPYLQSVHFDGANSRIGEIVNCKVTAVQNNSLSARAVEQLG
jgi:tRNA A37 methylthiotransferase MiaB